MLETALSEAGFSASTENAIRLLTLGLKFCPPWSTNKGKKLNVLPKRADTEEMEEVD